MKYTRTQIQNSIDYWQTILESMEHDTMIQEGFFKKARDAVSVAVKSAKDGVKNAAASAKEKVHDTFAANEGIKKLLSCISDGKGKMNPKITNAGKTQFKVQLPGSKTKVSVKGFDIFKNKLLLQVANVKDGRSLADFQQFVQEKKIKKLSSAADGIVICITKKQKDKDSSDFYDAFTKNETVSGSELVISVAKINDVKLDSNAVVFSFNSTTAQEKKEVASNAAFM